MKGEEIKRKKKERGRGRGREEAFYLLGYVSVDLIILPNFTSLFLFTTVMNGSEGEKGCKWLEEEHGEGEAEEEEENAEAGAGAEEEEEEEV